MKEWIEISVRLLVGHLTFIIRAAETNNNCELFFRSDGKRTIICLTSNLYNNVLCIKVFRFFF